METFAKGWLAQETHNHMDRPRQRQKDKKGILTEDKPFQTETDQETKSLGIKHMHCIKEQTGRNSLAHKWMYSTYFPFALEASKCTFGDPAS